MESLPGAHDGQHATMTATPDEIITKLVEKEAAIKRENGLAPQALLFAKKGGKGGGGNGGKAGKGGKIPRSDKRDNKGDNDRKEKDLWKCFHCQERRHITENYSCMQGSDPPKAADTADTASTKASATLTLARSIENFCIVSSSSA